MNGYQPKPIQGVVKPITPDELAREYQSKTQDEIRAGIERVNKILRDNYNGEGVVAIATERFSCNGHVRSALLKAFQSVGWDIEYIQREDEYLFQHKR